MVWNDFSVIIVTKNRYSQLLQSITSISNNSLKPTIIIVIDGSDKIDKNLITLIKTTCNKARVEILYIHHNANIAQNRNIGISKVKTKYFGFIDDDQYVPRNWILNVKNIFSSNQKIDVLTGPLLSKYPKNYWNMIWLDINKQLLKTEGRVDFVSGANTNYKTGFIRKNDICFDTRFTCAAEDWGISYKLQEKHAYIYQTPRLTVLHDFRTTIFSFIEQWYRYGIGIYEYHHFYLMTKSDSLLNKLFTAIRLLFSRYPIRRNRKSIYLIPGYIVLNISFFIGYLHSFLQQKRLVD